MRVIRAVGGIIHTHHALARRLKERPSGGRVTRVLNRSRSHMARVVDFDRSPISVRTPMKSRSSSRLNSFIRSSGTLSPRRGTVTRVHGGRVSLTVGSLASHRRRIVALQFNLSKGRPRALRRIKRVFRIAERHVHRVRTGTLHGLNTPDEGHVLHSFLWRMFY